MLTQETNKEERTDEKLAKNCSISLKNVQKIISTPFRFLSDLCKRRNGRRENPPSEPALRGVYMWPTSIRAIPKIRLNLIFPEIQTCKKFKNSFLFLLLSFFPLSTDETERKE